MPLPKNRTIYSVVSPPRPAVDPEEEAAVPAEGAIAPEALPSWPTWITGSTGDLMTTSAVPDRFRSSSNARPGYSSLPGEYQSSSRPHVGAR
jgi:hypothetical protein